MAQRSQRSLLALQQFCEQRLKAAAATIVLLHGIGDGCAVLHQQAVQLAQIGTALIHAGVALLLKGRALQGKAVAQKRRQMRWCRG